MGLMCLLFPSMIFCFVRNKITANKNEGTLNQVIFLLFEYFCGIVLINTILISGIGLIKHKTDGIFFALNNYTNFTIKYMVLAVILAALIPFVERYIKNSFSIKYEWNYKVNPISERYKNAILYCYAIFMAGLHFIRLFDNSFRGDEGIVVVVARMSTWTEMLINIAKRGHSPLHYVFAWVSIRIFGESGFVYHMSAALPYFFIVVITATMIKKYYGRKVSMILLTFSSLLECAVTYNLEIRMYVWCELFILLTYLMAFRFYSTKKEKYLVIMPIFALGAVYSHYFALASIGLFYAIMFFYVLKNKAKYIWKVVLSGSSVIVLFIPWLMFTKKTLGGIVSDYNIGDVSWRACFNFIFQSKYSIFLLICFAICLIAAFMYELGVIKLEKMGKKLLFRISFNPQTWQLSREWIWIFSGIIGVFGTIIAAKVFSFLFYPIICLRYLYVAYIIIWLLFGVEISKLKFSRLWTSLLIILIMISCWPNYFDVVKTEKANEKRLETTLESTQVEIDDKDFIYTDIVHFAWTVSNVYYPNTPHSLFGYPERSGPEKIDDLDSDTEYWLFLSAPIAESIKNDLNLIDYHADLVVDNGYIGTGDVWIYKVIRN